MQTADLGEAIAADFREALDELKTDLSPNLRAQAERSATRIAGYLELMLRNPDMADRLERAIQMEQGRLELIAARAHFEATTQLRDAAIRSVQRLITTLI